MRWEVWTRLPRAAHLLRCIQSKRFCGVDRRQYCTRRLRRLYKVLKLTHGRGRYQKRRLEPHMATDVRYLHVALVRAERSWAHAMELKNQIEAKVVCRPVEAEAPDCCG